MSTPTGFLKKLSGLHIILIPVFPVLSLYTANLGDVYIWETYRSVLVAILLSLLILGTGRVAYGCWSKAALFTSPVLMFLFSYGHIYNNIDGWQMFGLLIGRHRYLLTSGLLLLGFWGWLLKTKIEEVYRSNLVFLGISLALLATPILQWLSYGYNANSSTPFNEESEIHLAWDGDTEDLPDIYFIILDAYARSDTMETIYHWDNSDFLDALRQRGFYIADQSYCNHDQTLLSLSATLNLNYATDLLGEIDANVDDRTILENLIHHSQVRSSLEQLGYQLVAFDTPLPGTTIVDADIFWNTNTNQLLLGFNSFEGRMAETSIIRLVMDSTVLLTDLVGEHIIEPGYEAHRNRTLNIFNRMADPASMDGHYFVFVHIVAPHPPFIFGPNGERLSHQTSFTLKDGNHFQGTQEEYLVQYRGQAIFISEMVIEAIDRIQGASFTPPIIIIQSDHGPGAYLNWGNIEDTDLQERFGILNAIYLPDGGQDWLYPQISPVNTFRVVFNQYFSTNMPLLDDRSFFLSDESSNGYIEVTSQLK